MATYWAAFVCFAFDDLAASRHAHMYDCAFSWNVFNVPDENCIKANRLI